MRHHRLSAIPATPIAIESAMSPDAASTSLAPTAVNPLRMTAKDEAKPTKPVTRPAATGCNNPEDFGINRFVRREREEGFAQRDG